jgi:sugar/nucleoside kinase (ribokinase family)
VRTDGERLFVTYPGVLQKLVDFMEHVEPPATDVAFFSGWCQPPRVDGPALVEFFGKLREQKTSIVTDLSWSDESWNRRQELLDVLRHVDFALLNAEELAAIVGDQDVERGLGILTEYLGDKPTVIVKCGAKGALAKNLRHTVTRVNAPAVGKVSTVGAGDNFNAAFIAAKWDRQLDLAGATDYACTFASEMMKTGRRTI